ncbi:MAG: enoyl-ACP reductase FabI [Paludibacterium sp.]|uniref:enoyl-ACP reductase FabI n=1 Tax=Paludibacterium sp. TaxID=1917523 RepID=UPI0025E8D1FD|nr:enoyl-ACP reductase FabI [Paludibacterium sp.]MBV8049021.1 enoyl-ACP reductase FabI [Paludibacterium sp.]MBV8646052.1 enoyl-ACP reductase FabI [Paludibacterium sp.]
MDGIGNIIAGKKGLVVGIANDQSIAYGCASVLREHGAELAVTYLNEKAEKYVRPLAEGLDAQLVLPLNVEEPDQMSAVFEQIRQTWGKLDFVVHSIAYCPMEDLHGRVVDCSLPGFQQAMRVSCYSFLELAHHAEPLMSAGGTLLTMSYYGSDKVVENYNIMGPVKAALESVSRYMAHELGPKGIRVHALSPGPLKTRAASGIAHFDSLISEAIARAPQSRLVDIEDVGQVAAFLISDAARALTGATVYVDGGFNIMA